MTDKVAFLFLTRGEHHNINIWERFFEGADSSLYKIFIHPKDPSALKSPLWFSENSAVLKPIPTAWGTISLVKATIYLLQMAFSDVNVKKFVLLSEFCIPTIDFKTMYDCLKNEDQKSRICWTFGKNIDRYNIIKSYVSGISIHNWAKQSQWMCLDRRHVNFLFIPTKQHILGNYINDFKYCPAPDEHFFINFFLHVVKIHPNEFINHPITFVDWSTNSKHPKLFVFLPQDIINLCRDNKILFARKFAPLNISHEESICLLSPPKAPQEESPLTKEQLEIIDFFKNNKIRELTEKKAQLIYSAIFEKDIDTEEINDTNAPINTISDYNSDNEEHIDTVPIEEQLEEYNIDEEIEEVEGGEENIECLISDDINSA